MKRAKFTVVNQPQLAIAKSEGLRYIEHKAKIGCLYVCHAEPWFYCAGNVHGTESSRNDDIVVFEKIAENLRIDVFDASVFATIRMLVDTEKVANAKAWFVPNSDTDKKKGDADGAV